MARLLSLRDTPNTAREYETIYILRPNTANEGVAEVNTRIKGVIEGMGGKIIKVDNWGKRRLAYEVAKERKGIYLYWHYLAQPGVVEEAERNLRMLDSVIRYLHRQGRRERRSSTRGRARSTRRRTTRPRRPLPTRKICSCRAAATTVAATTTTTATSTPMTTRTSSEDAADRRSRPRRRSKP